MKGGEEDTPTGFLLPHAMKKITYILIGLIVMIFIVASIFVIKNKPEHIEAVSDSKTITSVPGVSFQINTNIVDRATAISQISEGIDISPNLFYIYKDGQENYILFSLDNIVVAVQKGTNFRFEEKDDPSEALEEGSVMDIWFDSDSRKFKPSTKNGRTIANVNAGVVITNDLYGDFVGQLAVVNDGATEYSIFAGIPGTGKFDKLPDEAKENLNAIVTSLVISNNTYEKAEEAYAVTIGTNEVEKVEVEKEIVETPTPAPETAEEAETEPKPQDDIVVSEVTLTSEPASENEEAKPKPIQVSNQNKIVNKKDDKAYSSDIYTMLSPGDKGIIIEYDMKNSKEEQPIIDIKNVYSGEEAKQIIQKYCASGKSGYNYFEADEGCSWNVIEYNLSYKNCITKPYINIQLKGFDGEELKYRGIRYSSKTFDIFSYVEEGTDWNQKYYCYYAVPNGCKEYVLECGTGCMDHPELSMNKAAYYKIIP